MNKAAEYLILTAVSLIAAFYASEQLKDLGLEVLNQIAQMINPS